MTDQEYEMPFETAKTVVQEIIRQNRGLAKLEDVLKAATRAENALKSLPKQLAELETQKDALKNEITDLGEHKALSAKEWETKIDNLQGTCARLFHSFKSDKKKIRKEYADLLTSLDENYKSKKAELDKALKALTDEVSRMEGERGRAQTNLNSLTSELSSVVSKFSADEQEDVANGH